MSFKLLCRQFWPCLVRAQRTPRRMREGQGSVQEMHHLPRDHAGQNKIGPSLFGVVAGNPAPSPALLFHAMQGFKACVGQGGARQILTDPRQVVPGTKMIFPGLKDEADRGNLIAYLETLK